MDKFMPSKPTYKELEQRIKELESEIGKDSQADKELLQSEKWFRMLLEQVPNVAVQGYGPDGTIQYWNQANEAIYGYTENEAIGNNLVELIIPHKMRDFVRVAIAEGAHTGEMPPPGELKLMRKDGSLVDVYSSHAIVQRPGNEPMMFCLDIDITDQKKAAKALKKSENRFRKLSENATDMIYRMSLPDGIYEYVSPASLNLFGYRPQEFYNNPLLIKSIIHPDWYGYFEKEWANLLKGKVLPIYEYQIVHKDKGVRWVNQRNTLEKDEKGIPIAIAGVVTDITERKNTEESLRETKRKLLETLKMASMGFWSWDVKTGEVEWSDEVYNIFQLDPKEFTPQIDSILALSPWPEENKRDAELIRNATETKEPGSYEQKFLFPDGSIGYYHSTFQGVYDEQGNLTAMKGTVQDITEKKRADEEQKKLEEQLQQAHKMEAIGTLAGGIAHDFNNILSGILGYSQFVKEYLPAGSPAEKDIDIVIQSGRRAANLVKQILTFSRKKEHHLQTLTPYPIVKEALQLMRSTLPATIAIKEYIDKKCGDIVADPTNIHQIIVNLCSNALCAMDQQKGVLTVKLYREYLNAEDLEAHANISAGSFVVLSVSDTGHGMDKATMRRIFEPYFTTKEIGKGSGIGLSVIYGIIEESKGFIRAESTPGQGSTFYVYLPALQEKSSTVDDDQDTAQTLEVSSIKKGSGRILVVDDEMLLVKINKRRLENVGYTVTVTTDSEEALEKIRNHPEQFDLLITDQTMPMMSGADLTREVLKVRPDLPVIMSTGHSEVMTEKKALEMGIRKYVLKPIQGNELIHAVQEILESNK
jgi:two-component system, cell cycle sensor histidine kinase and response regulator CckA